MGADCSHEMRPTSLSATINMRVSSLEENDISRRYDM